RVSRKAVRAGVGICDRDGDLFTQPRAELAVAKRSERAPHRCQRGGRVGHGTEHIRRHAERRVDLIEVSTGRTCCSLTVNEGNTSHEGSPLFRVQTRDYGPFASAEISAAADISTSTAGPRAAGID